MRCVLHHVKQHVRECGKLPFLSLFTEDPPQLSGQFCLLRWELTLTSAMSAELSVGVAAPNGNQATANGSSPEIENHTASQRYLSTRGGSYGVMSTAATKVQVLT